MAQVILPIQVFAPDLNKLGRANGNILQRIPCVEGVHDEQVMVRLKKKHSVILDYSIQPNEADLQYAAVNQYIQDPQRSRQSYLHQIQCQSCVVTRRVPTQKRERVVSTQHVLRSPSHSISATKSGYP